MWAVKKNRRLRARESTATYAGILPMLKDFGCPACGMCAVAWYDLVPEHVWVFCCMVSRCGATWTNDDMGELWWARRHEGC